MTGLDAVIAWVRLCSSGSVTQGCSTHHVCVVLMGGAFPASCLCFLLNLCRACSPFGLLIKLEETALACLNLFWLWDFFPFPRSLLRLVPWHLVQEIKALLLFPSSVTVKGIFLVSALTAL